MSDDPSAVNEQSIILYNQEVPQDVRSKLEDELRDTIHVDRSQTIYMMSQTVPELVQIVLDAVTWKNGLGTAAAIFFKSYLEKIGSIAAESSWKQSSAIAKVLKENSVEAIESFVDAIIGAKKSLSPNCRFMIGLPYPEGYRGTLLRIEADNREEIAIVLALFVTQVQRIQDRLSEEVDEENVAVGISLKLNEDGDFVATWYDREQQYHEIMISNSLMK